MAEEAACRSVASTTDWKGTWVAETSMHFVQAARSGPFVASAQPIVQSETEGWWRVGIQDVGNLDCDLARVCSNDRGAGLARRRFARRELRRDIGGSAAPWRPINHIGRNLDTQPVSALDGKHALVIGGSSGIGLGCARLLAKDGAVVTLGARTEGRLVEAVNALGNEGILVSWTVCDALDGGSVSAAVDTAADHGKLHIAVVIPGGASLTPVLNYEDDQFSEEVDLNVRPVYLALKYAGRAMLRAGEGSFVAISSTAAVFSCRYISSYSAGKAAVDQLIRVAANELGPYNIRVNSVRPGWTRTPATEPSFANTAMMQQFLDNQPIGRHGRVEDIAHAVRYMAGPESAWTTGQLLTVDGGNTLRSFIDYRSLMDLPEQGLELSGSFETD